MSNVALKTVVLKEALKNYTKTIPFEIKDTSKSTTISFTEENKDLLEYLQDNIPITAAQRSKINNWLVGPQNISEIEASSVSEFFRKLDFINTATEPMFEVKLANKWYPLMGNISKYKTWSGNIVEITLVGQIGALQYAKNFYLGEWAFTGNDDKPIKRHINEVLSKYDVRTTTPEAVEHAKKLASKVMEYNTQKNSVFDVSGLGLNFHQWWGWEDVVIGWPESPSTAIVEPNLENQYAHQEISAADGNWRLPFVRIFSLKHKSYVYVDVENLKEHVFHTDSKDKIVLPTKMMTALNSIFNAKQDHIFGDLFHGRHGGVVVLANGPSGVGKTLTAEVFAESQKRPLYSMEMGEIGTSLKEVEINLQKIFARAKKWNAVLLFDEADIFLSERVASDLERSAIVGIFLRLLDYYEGTFFLTTNRGEGIDKAFRSRVTLYLNYPDLSSDTRKKIWQHMIEAAGITVTENDVSWNEIANAHLNGRQIRNQVRLLKLMYPDNQVKTSDIIESLEFAAK